MNPVVGATVNTSLALVGEVGQRVGPTRVPDVQRARSAPRFMKLIGTAS